jgi:hypothetical protein
MIRALRGYSILLYEPPKHWEDKNGIILPSQSIMRDHLRNAANKTFDVNDVPPDVYRFGSLVSGSELGMPMGTMVYFNRHDADEIEIKGQLYYRINNKNALAYYVPEKNQSVDTATNTPVAA